MGQAALRPQVGVHIGEGATGTLDGTASGAVTDHVCDPGNCVGTSVGVEIVDPVLNPSVAPSTVVTNFDITGNDVGVAIEAREGLANPSPVLVGQNTISGNGTGVIVADADDSDAVAPNVSGTSNIISTNGAGVRNTAVVTIDLRRNWWGDASGPSDWSTGSGDSVSAGVQFFPWSTDAAFTAEAQCDLSGTNGADLLTGTDGTDIICGNKGPDRIVGFGGNDLLLGGRGDDVIKGGAGDDALLGSNGQDALQGHAGFDSMQGGPGLDTCSDSDAQTNSCP
jgi:Ca2+-binding RTX toxin-like protein